MDDHRLGWSAAWGIVALVCVAIGTPWDFFAASSPHKDILLWPVYGFGLIALVALYCVFAPLIGLPPWRRDRRPQVGENDEKGDNRQLPIQPAHVSGLVAARVIRGQLNDVRVRVVDALGHHDNWWRTLPDLPTAEWKQHGTALAAGPPGVYDAVRAAYGHVDRVSSACIEADSRERTSGHRGEGLAQYRGDDLIEAIDAAIEALGRKVDVPSLGDAALALHDTTDTCRRRIAHAADARVYWSEPMSRAVFAANECPLRKRQTIHKAVAAAYRWFDELNESVTLGAPMTGTQAADLKKGLGAVQHAVDVLAEITSESEV
jgi:hypothetical protein